MPPKRTRPTVKKIDRALTRLLKDEDAGVLLNALNPVERELLYKELRNLGPEPSTTELQSLNLDFTRKPPSMAEFIDNDFYLGRVLKGGEDNVGLYPLWREILIRDFDLDSRIHNLVITGSLGTGKTTIMVVLLLYRIVVTSLLRNPQNFFGLSRGSAIVYNFLSVTREAVRETAFGAAMTFMGLSPYFVEVLKYNPDLKYSNGIVPFPNRLFITAGSKSWHVLGRNVLGIGLDEGNFRLEANPDQQAYVLYDQVRRRISNRFQKIEGFLPAISCIASSAQDESSFTERVIRDIESANSPRTQTVYRQPIYRIKRHELKLGPRWFRVAYGLKNQEPCVLGGWYSEAGAPIQGPDTHEEPPQGARTELIPEMYLPEFKRNCRSSLQDLAGISTGGTHRLFASMVDVERCLEMSEREGLKSPVKGGARLIPISTEDKLFLWDYVIHKSFLTKVNSRVQPLRHPNSLRYAHMDLATSSKAGLAICHLVGAKKIDGVIVGGHPFEQYRLIVEYDFILTICAGQVKSISFEKICNFFHWLRDTCHFRFGKITADMYQSAMPLESLEGAGFEVGKLSVDRDKSAYTAWKSGFEDHRIRLYRSPEMLAEAEDLLETDHKYDHPINGSKDTTDACAGAFVNAVSSDERSSFLVDPAPGIITNRDPDTTTAAPPISIPLPTPPKRAVKTFKL